MTGSWHPLLSANTLARRLWAASIGGQWRTVRRVQGFPASEAIAPETDAEPTWQRAWKEGLFPLEKLVTDLCEFHPGFGSSWSLLLRRSLGTIILWRLLSHSLLQQQPGSHLNQEVPTWLWGHRSLLGVYPWDHCFKPQKPHPHQKAERMKSPMQTCPEDWGEAGSCSLPASMRPTSQAMSSAFCASVSCLEVCAGAPWGAQRGDPSPCLDLVYRAWRMLSTYWMNQWMKGLEGASGKRLVPCLTHRRCSANSTYGGSSRARTKPNTAARASALPPPGWTALSESLVVFWASVSPPTNSTYTADLSQSLKITFF